MNPSQRKASLAPTGPAGEGLFDRLHRAWGESPFYQAQLNGPAPDRFAHMAVDPRSPVAAAADMIVKSRFAVGMHSVDCEGEIERVWDLADRPGPLHAFLHEFTWLRHATALGEAGKEPARKLLKSWLDRYERWSPTAWSPLATGERLVQLCSHGGYVLRGGDALWRSRVFASMARQTRHLARTAHRAGAGGDRLMTALALTIAGFCLPGCRPAAERGLDLLRRELRLQIRPDGGHISRNPSLQLSILIRLQMAIKAIEAARIPVPGFLLHVESRAAAFLHIFRCADGRLAVFNGGYEDDAKALVSALSGVDPDAAPMGFARHSGFQRLEAGRLVLVADTGAAQRAARAEGGPGDGEVFVGEGAFSLASGRVRLVVNCGNGAHLSADWAAALRKAAAHSCASCDIGGDLIAGASASHRRGEDARGQLLEIERASPDLGARHRRQFFMGAGGDDLRGRDVFSLGAATRSVAVRFHLHPAVKVSMARDGRTVLIAAPGQEGWRFRSNCPQLSLEKSVYCGEGGAPASTMQIVLRPFGLEPGPDGDITLKWAFRRED